MLDILLLSHTLLKSLTAHETYFKYNNIPSGDLEYLNSEHEGCEYFQEKLSSSLSFTSGTLQHFRHKLPKEVLP